MGPLRGGDAEWALQKYVGKSLWCKDPSTEDGADNERLEALVASGSEVRYSMLPTDEPLSVVWTKELQEVNLERLAWEQRCKLSICTLEELGYTIKHNVDGVIREMRDAEGLVVQRRYGGRPEGKVRMMRETDMDKEAGASVGVHVRQRCLIAELRVRCSSISRRHSAQVMKARRLKRVCLELLNAIADGTFECQAGADTAVMRWRTW
jgi:hypothetical protein